MQQQLSWLALLTEITLSFAGIIAFLYGIGVFTVYYYYLISSSKEDGGDGY